MLLFITSCNDPSSDQSEKFHPFGIQNANEVSRSGNVSNKAIDTVISDNVQDLVQEKGVAKAKELEEEDIRKSVNKDKSCDQILKNLGDLRNSLLENPEDDSLWDKYSIMIIDPITKKCEETVEFKIGYNILIEEIEEI